LQALTILLGSSLTVMAGAAVAPALPTIAAAFSDVPNSEFLVKLILTLPALLIALCSPLMGLACDAWGRRPVLMLGIVGYALAGCSALFLSDLYAILAGRAALGVAVAAVLTSCSTLIGDYYVGHERDRFMGLQAAFMSFSGVLFPLASGALVTLGWREPFLVYLASLLVLPGVVLYLVEPKRHAHHTSEPEDTAPFPWGLVLLVNGLAILQMSVFYLIPVQFSFYLQELVSATGLQVGMALSFASLCIGSASLLFHRVRGIWSPTPIIAGCMAFIGAGYLVLGHAQGWGVIVAGLLIAALGLGILGPNLTTWLLAHTPERLRGRLVGMLAASFFVGQFASPLLAQPIIEARNTATVYTVAGGLMLVLSLGFGAYSAFNPKDA
jgi:MFS family permease